MITVHRIIGLVLGVWLTVVGLTGAFLVYHQEFDTWLHADMMTVAAAPTALPDFDRMAAVVAAAHPERRLLYFERYGLNPLESAPFVMSAPGADMSRIADPEDASDLEVFVDQNTFQILGERPYATWMRTVRSLHMELLVPKTGERILGAIGVVVLTTVIAGIVLWWRDNKHRLGRGLRLRWSSPTPRLMRDLHTVSGIYIAVFLIWQVASGVLVCDWFQVRTFFAQLFGTGPAGSARIALPEPAPEIPVTLNMARDTALAVHPASIVVLLKPPLTPAGRISVRLFPTDEPKARHMRQIEVNARTGKIQMRFDPDLVPTLQAFMNLWMIWIHKGEFLGWPGRIIVLITGLTLATLFPTGVYIWDRKRKSRGIK